MSESSMKSSGCLTAALVVFATLAICFTIVVAMPENNSHREGTALPISPIVQVTVTNALPSLPSVHVVVTNELSAVSSDSRFLCHDSLIPDGMSAVSDEEIKRRREEELEATRSLLLMNHVNWVVTKIKSYNDPMVLEQEYDNINQNAIRLDNIKDAEIIDTISRIMDVITEMRIEERKRQMLKDELDQGMSDAVYDAFSGISAGSGISPVGAIFNVVSSAVTAGMNYKKAKARLLRTYTKQTWALDENRMRYLNELNTDLLVKYWQVVQKRGVDDGLRVTEHDIKELIERMKDENKDRRRRFLCDPRTEQTYIAFANYWYYRGATCYECGDVAGAVDALAKYQKLQGACGQILRKDTLAAKAALLLVKIKLDGPCENEEVCEQLEIVLANCDWSDWTVPYFCALVYAERLSDFNAADEIVRRLVDGMEVKSGNSLLEWQDLVEERGISGRADMRVAKPAAAGDALFECKTLLARIGKGKLSEDELNKRLEAICNEQTSSARERLFCYFTMGYRQALERLEPDLRRIRIYADSDSEVRVLLPLSWIRSREGEMSLYLTSVGVDNLEKVMLCDTDSLKKAMGDTPGRYFDKDSEARVSGLLNRNERMRMVSERVKDGEEDREILEEPDGSKYVVLKFDGQLQEAKTALFAIRYLKGDTRGYQVLLAFHPNGDVKVFPYGGAIGDWVFKHKDADGKISVGRWGVKEDGVTPNVALAVFGSNGCRWTMSGEQDCEENQIRQR